MKFFVYFLCFSCSPLLFAESDDETSTANTPVLSRSNSTASLDSQGIDDALDEAFTNLDNTGDEVDGMGSAKEPLPKYDPLHMNASQRAKYRKYRRNLSTQSKTSQGKNSPDAVDSAPKTPNEVDEKIIEMVQALYKSIEGKDRAQQKKKLKDKLTAMQNGLKDKALKKKIQADLNQIQNDTQKKPFSQESIKSLLTQIVQALPSPQDLMHEQQNTTSKKQNFFNLILSKR